MSKLVKVIFTSVILSFLITLVASILNYTPISEREPNTYYSIMDNLVFGMLYITPIVLMVNILAIGIYLLMKKFWHIPKVPKLFISISISISIVALTMTIVVSQDNSKTNDIYLIPKGYEGDVYAFYNVKGAPEIKREGDFEVHRINEKGYYVTSEAVMDYGTVTDKYFYVDKEGNRTPISGECVSIFGTGGFSTSDNVEIDISYTGFRLTKDQCGEAFMVQSHGMGEKKGELIPKILKEYYGIDRY